MFVLVVFQVLNGCITVVEACYGEIRFASNLDFACLFFAPLNSSWCNRSDAGHYSDQRVDVDLKMTLLIFY